MGANITQIFDIEDNADGSIIAASNLFLSGKTFIYPTDTIYGIGGNPFNENCTKKINEIKGRDETKQFIWLISDIDNLLNYADINLDSQLNFLNKIWPDPVSVILNLNSRSKDQVGYKSAAFRIPDNLFCRNLLNEIRLPLISTSVNKSGKEPLNDYIEIINDFSEKVDAIFYSNKVRQPLSSTIIDLQGNQPILIREGAIKFVDLLRKFN